MDICFSPADILIPAHTNLEDWSVVACDQYTSEPSYWERVARRVEDAPSTFHLILPEVWLDQPDLDARIARVNAAMDDCLTDGLFTTFPDSYVYVERTVAPGKVRRGLVGKLDLEAYSYTPGAQTLARPTEGTVESRLPPRVQVRQSAPLELPHIMVLLDDTRRTVIEPLAGKTARMHLAYDFELMENGGRVRGFVVDDTTRAEIDAALGALLSSLESYCASFPGAGAPMLYAMGDGNHSLAAAKACYEQLKRSVPESVWKNHPSRWALVELVNVHDQALAFEPIHRIVRGVNPAHLLGELKGYFEVLVTQDGGQSFEAVTALGREQLWIANPTSSLAVGSLQNFLDGYLAAFGGTIDYIHGDAVLRTLAAAPDAVGFLLPALPKSQLFSTVILDGVLPRKTFSMGHAQEKRYYLECRRIR